jgi:hypothetical protein
MYKVYQIDNYSGAEYLTYNSNSFELSMINLRSDMRRNAVAGWRIVRSSDNVVLAQWNKSKL